jgi:hypothetical protein
MALLFDMVFHNTMSFDDTMRHDTSISTMTQIHREFNPHHCCLTPPLPATELNDVHTNVDAAQAARQQQHSAGLAYDVSDPQDGVGLKCVGAGKLLLSCLVPLCMIML